MRDFKHLWVDKASLWSPWNGLLSRREDPLWNILGRVPTSKPEEGLGGISDVREQQKAFSLPDKENYLLLGSINNLTSLLPVQIALEATLAYCTINSVGWNLKQAICVLWGYSASVFIVRKKAYVMHILYFVHTNKSKQFKFCMQPI